MHKCIIDILTLTNIALKRIIISFVLTDFLPQNAITFVSIVKISMLYNLQILWCLVTLVEDYLFFNNRQDVSK